MKIQYFADTDTLYIALRDEVQIVETRDLDEQTLGDFDAAGHLCAMTVEHASQRVDLPRLQFAQVPA